MMRTLHSLTACLLLAGSLGAASQLAPGVFHLANHPDGGWQGPSKDGSHAEIGYGLILTDWIYNPAAGTQWAHVIFDFNHIDATMKLQNKPKQGKLRFFGTAWAWGSMTTRSQGLAYESLGMAKISITFTGGGLEDPVKGKYADVVFDLDDHPTAQGAGFITMPDGSRYLWRGKARNDGLIVQAGDFDGAGERLSHLDPALWEPYVGKFTTGRGGGRGRPVHDDVATAISWLEKNGQGDGDGEVEPKDDDPESDKPAGSPSDFITLIKPRNGEAFNN